MRLERQMNTIYNEQKREQHKKENLLIKTQLYIQIYKTLIIQI